MARIDELEERRAQREVTELVELLGDDSRALSVAVSLGELFAAGNAVDRSRRRRR